MTRIRLIKGDLIIEIDESNQQKFLDNGFNKIHYNDNPKRVGTKYGKKIKKDNK